MGADETGFGIREGLRVMISGAATGIGRVMLDVFVAAGARVHVCDASAEALEACLRARPEAGGTVADVADAAHVARWFDAAERFLGGLDVLVNNAGIGGPTAPVEQVDPTDWLRTLDVNLSSAAGRFGYPMRTPYAAPKWAVVGFTSASRRASPWSSAPSASGPTPFSRGP